jgi:phosphoenolpyruvate carboxykinase (ATP)
MDWTNINQKGSAATSVNRYYQLSIPELVAHALKRGEGRLSERGALIVNTGKYTGRSPDDRFIVDQPSIHDKINWGKVNKPISQEVFNRVRGKIEAFLSEHDYYVFDGFCGADPRYALKVRVVTEQARHSLFMQQMLVRPTPEQLKDFKPDFTILDAPSVHLDPASDGVNSEAAILLSIEDHMVVVAASQYAGEMKKSAFSYMNYLMPERDVFPMHCSANVGKDGRSALFFGLSGTGKTTLSADPDRLLVGDDEHGWSNDGIFNFEGGCYAKTINLKKEHEPIIWDACSFGAVGENIILDEKGVPNFDDGSLTENTRLAYPVEMVPNAVLNGMAPHPSAVIFLTADAFGVMPPISRLTPEAAQYHFISGYTSKLAGTERGIKEPQAAFSTCFGAPFMPLPSAVYAEMLKRRIQTHKASVYLVNTGWQGGPYGVGKRISIPHTRAMIAAALSGELDKAQFRRDENFNVDVPTSCPGVPSELLDPRSSWQDKGAYDAQAKKLAGMFVENFKKFQNVEHLVAAGPKA